MTRPDSNWTLRISPPGQRGFSLIEVMVTLAIVSVAALGMARLQTATLRSNNNALVESQAATIVQDLIERIRANPDGDYTTAFEENINVAATCAGLNANCDVDAMARYDLLQWKCALGAAESSEACAGRGIAGQLPGGDGSITFAGNIYTITIRWFDAASDEDRTIVISTVL